MKILKSMQKVPGGMLVIPLVLAMLINSFFPHALSIGSFTTALFKNATQPLLALDMFCAGSQINMKTARVSLAKGGLLTLVKVAVGGCIGLVIGRLAGPSGILGLSVLAILPAMTNSNSSLFAALAEQNGDETDVGALSIIALNNGPLFTMLLMGSSGIASISPISFVAIIVPIIVGFILGNLDADWKDFLKHSKMLIPFLGFSIGASLNLQNILKAGGPGVLLGFATVLITGLAGYLIYGVFKGSVRAVGAAIGTSAGIAAATPSMIAAIDPAMKAFVSSATVQISASIIVTAVFCPVLVSLLKRAAKKKGGKPAPVNVLMGSSKNG